MKMILYLVFSSGYTYSGIFEDFCEADSYVVYRLACVTCVSCLLLREQSAVLV